MLNTYLNNGEKIIQQSLPPLHSHLMNTCGFSVTCNVTLKCYVTAETSPVERPGNLTCPKSYFEIEISRKVGHVLTSNEVNFVSLADTFTVQFSNLLKLLSGMENKTA